jgi:MFS family permease
MKTQENQVPQNTAKLKEIPKWARKYAQNRTLTILVLTAMTALLGMFIAALVGFPLALAVIGFWKGKTVLGCIGTAVLVAVLVAIVKFYIFMFAKFGGKNKGLLDQIIDRWIYRREGFTSMPQPKLSKKRKCLDIFVGIAYMVCLLGSMELGMSGYIEVKYILPLMALFVVPFGVYQYFTLWPRLGPVLLLFPILYAVHAILIIAGVPIFFTGIFAVPLNMLLPLIYTLLTYMIGHFYSRYALKKLKGITHLEGGAANGN